jgi:hypothetical protein
MQGYPQFFIFMVLGIGISLAVLKPYKSFLLIVVLLTAGNADTFNQTRTSLLGPYLNLGDACLLVALLALFFDKFRSEKTVWLPKIVLALLFVLTIAALQSFWKLGWTYETARMYRWGIQLPVAFFIAANFVDTSARAKAFIGALLCGAVLAAVQHLYYVWVAWRIMNLQAYSAIRTISYLGGCMSSAFLVTAVIWKLPANLWKKIPFLMAGILFFTSLLMNQTRSLWFATAGAVLCLLVLFKRRNRIVNIMRFGIIVVLVVFAAVWVSQHVMTELNVFDLATRRIKLLFDEDARIISTGTRERAFKAEMGSWLNGTLLFGRGLYFMQTIRNPEVSTHHIAFCHLGYVTYLSQMGLIGLLVYSVYFPLSVVRQSRWLWQHGDGSVLHYMGLLGGASIILLSIMFVMSSSFLGLSYFAPSVLYGSVWSMARRERKTINES